MSLSDAILLALSFPLLALAPLLFVGLLSSIARKTPPPNPLRTGNPLLAHRQVRSEEPPLALPLVHVIRTSEEARLRESVLALRHVPAEQA